MTRVTRTAVVALAALVGAAPAAARAQGLSLGGRAGAMWVRSDSAAATSRLFGPAVAGEAQLDLGFAFLGGSLLEGRFEPPTGPQLRHDLVEAVGLAGLRLWPWLEVGAGPHIRAYVTDAGTERWVWWEVRARVALPLIGSTLGSYLVAWRSFSAESNVVARPGRAQGGAAGLTLWPEAAWSVWAGYQIDEALLAGGKSETVESLGLGLTWRP